MRDRYTTPRSQQARQAPRYRQRRPARLFHPQGQGTAMSSPSSPAEPPPPVVPAMRSAASAPETPGAPAVATVTREDLERLHPAWVEGLPLAAVLDQAAVEDYEDLLDPVILAGFARALISSATLDPRCYRAEARAYRQGRPAPGAAVEEGTDTGGARRSGWKVLDIPPGRVPGSVLVAPVVRFSRWWVERVDGQVMAVELPRALSFREMDLRVAERPGLFNGVGVRRFWVKLVGEGVNEAGACMASRDG